MKTYALAVEVSKTPKASNFIEFYKAEPSTTHRSNALYQARLLVGPLEANQDPGFRVCVRTGTETAGPSTSLRFGRDDNSVGLLRSIPLAVFWALSLQNNVSSRPKRSEVEGPAVSVSVLTQTL
jgi:hypothetical protein